MKVELLRSFSLDYAIYYFERLPMGGCQNEPVRISIDQSTAHLF